MFGDVKVYSNFFTHGVANIANETPANSSAFLVVESQHKMNASPLVAEIATYLVLPMLPLTKSANDKRSVIEIWSECERAFTFYRQHKVAMT